VTERHPLGDVAPLVRRPVEPAPRAQYTEIGVRSYGKGLFAKPAVSGADLGTKRIFQIRQGDLVVSNVFAWEGAIAVASEEHAGTIGSHRFMTMTPTEGVSAAYLQHYLLTTEGLSQVRAASPGSAGRNRTLSLRGLSQLSVPVPSAPEQLRIVQTLQAAEVVLDDLRLRLTASGPRNLAASLPSLLGDRLRALPVPAVPCGELFDVVNDVVHPGDDLGQADCFVGLQHVEPHTGRLLGTNELGDETGRKFRFAPGDVLYGYLRPYLNKVWVADRHGLCSVEQFVLRPRAEVDAQHLATCLRSDLVLIAAIDATNNLQLPRLGLAKLQSFLVPDLRAVWHALDDVADLRERVCCLVDARSEQITLHGEILPRLREEVFAPHMRTR
jgi:type I restriction enzyme S subunit